MSGDRASRSTWRCPHCATNQPEAPRCWVCGRSPITCRTCLFYRRSVAGSMGFCALDRARTVLTGLESRPCWQAIDEVPGAGAGFFPPAAVALGAGEPTGDGTVEPVTGERAQRSPTDGSAARSAPEHAQGAVPPPSRERSSTAGHRDTVETVRGGRLVEAPRVAPSRHMTSFAQHIARIDRQAAGGLAGGSGGMAPPSSVESEVRRLDDLPPVG